MIRLVHLTDLHMTKPKSFARFLGKRCLGYLSWERNRRFIHRRSILDLVSSAVIKERPNLLAVTGDLVQLGLPEEIEEAADWLREMAEFTNVFVVPGNHDVYSASSVKLMEDVWRPYTRLDAAYFPTKVVMDSIVVIGLSSATPTPFWSAAGEITQLQLDRLKQLLLQFQGKFVCVLIHHPITSSGISVRKQLKNYHQLEKMFSEYQVDLVLHGHMHLNKEYKLNSETQIFCTASASSNKKCRAASYRVFDINQTTCGFKVDSALKIFDVERLKIKTAESKVWSIDKTR